MTYSDLAQYVGIAAWAFLSATLLPISSEAGLWLAISQRHLDPILALIVASVGNIGGSLLNWWLGLRISRLQGTGWSPLSPKAIARARERFMRYGVWSLLLAWVPVVGDPLTFVAGLLGVPLRLFLPLVAIGKIARYSVIVWGAA